MKKEIVYTVPYETDRDIKKAQRFRDKLYEKYDDVQVYPNGMYEVRIIAQSPIK